jgi:serralysin
MATLKISGTATAPVSLETFIADYVSFTSAQDLGGVDTYEFADSHFMFGQLSEFEDKTTSLTFATKTGDDSYVNQARITGLDISNDFISVVQEGDAAATMAYILSGDDTLIGGRSADRLNAYDGTDHIDGKAGNDVLTGGDGSDVFVFKAGYDRDTIKDFDFSGRDHDIVDFTARGIDTYRELKHHMHDHGNDVWIDISHGDRLVLKHVDMTDLRAADFDL